MNYPWHGFDEIIDVRSPKEYTEDCIPGAVNLPALSDAERAAVGTMHKNSPFAARRYGAGLLAANLAAYLQTHMLERPATWRPLVYCWRGGQRSGAVVDVLQRIGWKAQQLSGGYKAYRHEIINGIALLAARPSWRVLTGKTGVGKTRLLAVLRQLGATVVDLEALAEHRGSAFGRLSEQPSQRQFESRLFTALINLPTDGPVFVEAESRKIGCIHLPQPLLIALRAAPTMQIKAELIYRTTHIINDYQEMREDAAFASAMEVVGKYMERQRLAQWCRWQQAGEWEQLVADLLVSFYDVGYRQSLSTNYAATGDCYHVNPNDNESLEEVARALIAHSTTQHFSSDKIEVC